MVDWDSFFTPVQLLAGIVLIAITSSTFYRSKTFPLGGIIVLAFGFTLLALPFLESLAVGPAGLTIQIRTIVEEQVEAATVPLRTDIGRVADETTRLTTEVRELYEQAEGNSVFVTDLRDWAATVSVVNPTVPDPPSTPMLLLPNDIFDQRIHELRVREEQLRDIQLRNLGQ